MKAVILCGGKGTRLAGETEFKPKPLVEIGGRPILWHIMKIYSSQGIKDFILCLGYKGHMIKDYFLKLEERNNDFVLDLRKNKIYHLTDNEGLDVRITFVDTGQEVMTGARIARIQKYIGNDEDFFMTYGDGVSDIDLRKLYSFHKRKGKVATLTAVHPVYKYGLVEIEDDLIKKFDEKPNMKDLINGGFMVFNQRIFSYLSTEPNCILEQEPMKKLAEDNELGGYVHTSFWKSMDTQKDVDELNEIHEQGAPWEVWKGKESLIDGGDSAFSEEQLSVCHSDNVGNLISQEMEKNLNSNLDSTLGDNLNRGSQNE
ncbi:glucose-1-phosphate cytidylyltransferase [archaeon]|jgi:glucose-1-phosphate cytidylyltransferase|nr:glucose-1-phosphate cytidylyltransferase [archaeon]MBT4242083.1 glucose-1-phosphate cytidylyltransferase [archaeon]MBT4417771.1 glucose-1-phosphate cytidylyltransferase [archaeon]